MSVVLRQLLISFALLACAMALLPPAGFALCVDADRHLVIEADDPGPGMCCLPGTGTQADESCRPDDCVTCVDYALSAGDVLRATDVAGAMPEQSLTSPTLNDDAPVRLPARVLPIRAAEARAAHASARIPLRL